MEAQSSGQFYLPTAPQLLALASSLCGSCPELCPVQGSSCRDPTGSHSFHVCIKVKDFRAKHLQNNCQISPLAW